MRFFQRSRCLLVILTYLCIDLVVSIFERIMYMYQSTYIHPARLSTSGYFSTFYRLVGNVRSLIESSLMGRILCPLAILLLSAAAAAHSSHAHTPTSPLQGLVGYGISMFEPSCAFSCQRILQKSKLSCSTPPAADRWHGGSGLGFDTPDECYASDNAYLTSLASCLHQHCEEPSWILSRFWVTEIPGRPTYEYEEALKLSNISSLKDLVP